VGGWCNADFTMRKIARSAPSAWTFEFDVTQSDANNADTKEHEKGSHWQHDPTLEPSRVAHLHRNTSSERLKPRTPHPNAGRDGADPHHHVLQASIGSGWRGYVCHHPHLRRTPRFVTSPPGR